MRHFPAFIAVAAALGVSSASAATIPDYVTYYYVGAPAQVSTVGYHNAAGNYVDRMPFNTGSIKIDRSKAPGGSLANARFKFPVDHLYRERPEAVGEFQFSVSDVVGGSSGYIGFDLEFDAHENLVAWDIFTSIPGAVGAFGDSLRVSSKARTSYGVPIYEHFNWWDWDGVDEMYARDKLMSLGYTEDHPDFGHLKCGSWTGIEAFCNREDGEIVADPAWTAQLIALSPGQWFKDDLAAYTNQVIYNTQLAALNPPKHFKDIPPATPVPLPGSLPLMAGGIMAGIALLRRRRAPA